MKCLVATKETSMPEAGDFAFAHEGEPVYKPERCASEKHPDCMGLCRKALAGIHSRFYTNTVKVADLPVFQDDIDGFHESIPDLRAEAEKYEIGAVLEVRPDGLFLRQGEHVWQELFLDD